MFAMIMLAALVEHFDTTKLSKLLGLDEEQASCGAFTQGGDSMALG